MCYSFIPNGAEVKYGLFHGRDRTSTLPNRVPKKFVTFWEEEEVRQAKLACEFLLASHFRRGPPMMSKTVLDLLHSLGVEDDMIMFDNFGG